jgi:FixJ family two-component response regulator
LLEKERPEIIENVPVVFVTGMGEVPESKAVGFIRKPTDMDKFLKAVHSFIKRA